MVAFYCAAASLGDYGGGQRTRLGYFAFGALATTRLAAGATAVRDMIVQAWEESAEKPVGYPMVNVKDIESGKVRATREMFGVD